MITVRSIITEALSRANLVSRRQQAPADMFETAYQLLRGIAKRYSDDNLLQFLVSEARHDLDAREFVVGSVDPEAPEEYLPVDIDAPNIQRINRMYWRAKDPTETNSYIELQFASVDDFDGYPSGAPVYTWQPINDREIHLKVKLVVDTNCELKFTYNRKWDFDRDSELRIPGQYEELFIVALTHALARNFPRLSTEQVNLLEKDLKELQDGVKVSTRAVKYVTRRGIRGVPSRTAFISGSMFFPEG